MYKAQYREGRGVWIRKDAKVTQLQEHIKAKIRDLGITIPDDVYCYQCDTLFCSSKDYWMVNDSTRLRLIDTTNIFKVVEDGIFEALGINDALGVHNTQSKCLLPPEIESPPHYCAVQLVLYRIRHDKD